MGNAGSKADPIWARLSRWRGPRTARQRLLLSLVAIAIMVAFVAPLFKDTTDTTGPRARAGTIDFGGRSVNRPVPLEGQWRVTWLGPGPATGAAGFLPVPGQWTGLRIGRFELGPHGHARYDLVLRGLPAGIYTMHFPVIWAGNRIVIDGKTRAALGTIGESPSTTRYELRAHTIPFEARGGDVRVSIEMAAFLHRDNGLEEAPVIGPPGPMETWYAYQWSRELVYHVSLLLIAALGIAIFLFRPKDRASLYFSLACLFFLPVMAIMGFDNILQLMIPRLSFIGSLIIQYFASVLAVAFFFAHTHSLFPRESSKPVAWTLFGLLGAFALWQGWNFAHADTYQASLTQPYLMRLALFILVYIQAIMIRAAWRGRDGALVLLLGMVLFFASFLPGALVQTGWVRQDHVVGYEYGAIGVIMLLYTNVVQMAERWSLSVRRAEEANDELRQLLEVNTAVTSDLQLGSLLDKIVSVTSRIIRADRTSLFLKDENNPELATLVAEGVEEGAIRVETGRGLAGYVFATGETVNLPDAYADERFNRSVDEATGYRTASVLTVPVTARDGRRIGVMQALNHEDGQPFTADDAARMSAFGAQAAVAIDNARLFSEAVSARNFDDSILRSMSGGVIALDRDWKITKLNAAASDILGATRTLLGGLDARALLGRNNPWLIDEIEAVVAGGEPRLLLDVELVTARAKPSSVNVTITRLEGEDGPAGILLVIEDISEGKRLQGTMRRFMTQAVVEQVMSRDDEALFGTACEASVLFADIRGFTSMAEELSARETVETLNELFTELYEAVSDNDGVLDKYIGDAVMAVFGAPISSGRDPENALAAGLEMLRMLDAINLRRCARDQEPMRIGIGIATGEVVAGTIGSPKRMDYTVIGDSVNLAARLQDLTKAYGVEMLVDEATARAIGTDQPLREIDLIAVRGRKRPETVYEVLGRETDRTERLAAQHAAYARGRARLAARDWAGAAAAFAEAAELNPDDRPAQLMLARARMLAGAPPSEPWDGVWRDHAAAA